MRPLFVTSSGTGIGKTVAVTGLIRRLRDEGRRVEAFKPVASGFDPGAVEASDTGRILDALRHAATPAAVERVSPWRFAAPLSPDMAAAREGRRLDLDEVVAFCRARLASDADAVLIEGVGGVMVPLTERHTVLDWIAALGVPALLVAGSYLGTLSHTLTAAAALRSRGVEVRVLVSESEESPVPLAETVAALGRHLPGVEIASCPRLDPGAARALALPAPLVARLLPPGAP